MYLPPNSQDLNSIEKLFAKFKGRLSMFAERTVEDLWHRVGELIELFTLQESLNYIHSFGYTAKHM